jgi:phage terminase large subunit GpA-like protein
MAVTTLEEELLPSFQEGWEPPFDGEIYEWANKYVDLHNVYSIPGHFDISRSRFLIEPFKALKDLRIRQVNIMASPRCAKTLLSEIFLLHTIANNAGTFLFLQSTGEKIDQMAELRMVPLLKSCEPVKALLDPHRFAVTKNQFKFPHMSVHLDSAKLSALQSIGYKFIVGDEVWLWDAGLTNELQARVGDFKHSSKILLISQGGIEGDDWTTEFEKAPVYEWGWLCPSCQKEQVYYWNKQREDGTYAGIIWDKNDKTCPDGVWDVEEAAKTARLECLHCKHQVSDNPQNRRYLNDTGRYICTNPKGDIQKRSYRWTALANIEVSFAEYVKEFLHAKNILAREGNKLPLQAFHQKKLARSFNTSIQTNLAHIITADYDPLNKWSDEAYRFMTIDCQNEFKMFYYVIRAWAKNGASRQITRGYAATFDELAEIQQHNLVRDQNVLIDSGFQTKEREVYAECIKRGHVGIVGGKQHWLSWIALKGFDCYDFHHKADGTRKLYSTETKGDPNKAELKGKTCSVYLWSNYSIKNILVHLRDGKGAEWVTSNSDDDYERQLNSELLTRTIDKKTNKEKWIWVAKPNVPNHYWDCECMQLVAACMVGILGNSTSKT